MKAYSLLLLSLLLGAQAASAQRLLLTGGYTSVGRASFPGAPSLGLHATISLGQHLVVGLTGSAARARHTYDLYIPGPWYNPRSPGRWVSQVHNYAYTGQLLVGYRTSYARPWSLTVAPSAGLNLVGSREDPGGRKLGFGLWTNLSYHPRPTSRLRLEAVLHPRILTKGPRVYDAEMAFSDVNLLVCDAQLGLSLDLRRDQSKP